MGAQASVVRRGITGRTGAGSHEFFLLRGAHSIVMPRLMLVLAVAALTVLGLVMVYSASTVEAIASGDDPASYMVKQIGACALGVALCLLIALRAPYYVWLGNWLKYLWVATMLLLLATVAIGTTSLGAQRWIRIGGFSFQPSEVAKVTLVLTAARIWFLYENGETGFDAMVRDMLLFVIVPLGVLYVTQSDMGTAIICVFGILAVLWLGEVPLKWTIGILALLGLVGAAALMAKGYRSSRVDSWLDPYSDPYGTGYQIIHAFYAFGQGGLFGVGLGNSTEKYQYLPEAETDFIFAIIGEELGLIGAFVTVALFVVILFAGLQIARKAPDSFGAMIAGGCTVMLVFQAFLNIACVTNLIPTTGKPLPFISSGGSSLVGSYLLVGVILSVSLASGDDSGVYEARRDSLLLVRQDPPSRVPDSRRGAQAARSDAGSRGFRVVKSSNGSPGRYGGGRAPARRGSAGSSRAPSTSSRTGRQGASSRSSATGRGAGSRTGRSNQPVRSGRAQRQAGSYGSGGVPQRTGRGRPPRGQTPSRGTGRGSRRRGSGRR